VRSQDLKKAKRDVRRAVLAARDQLSAEEREAQAAAVVDRLLALPELAGAQTVMAFSSFGSELPTTQLIEALDAAGVRVVLPVIVDGEIEAHAFRPGDPTNVTHFGALEPAVRDEAVSPTAIDAVVVPGVAFDRGGRRVGYGGGFYDRFLPRTRARTPRIGIGLSAQLVDDDLPAGDFDLRVDVVVVPDEVVRCSR
jgi:5-formyltetrahydrofolate cyclo-ligase